MINEIVQTIGPRPACSEYELRSAEWVASHLRNKGCDVEITSFGSVPSFTLTFGLLAVAGLSGYYAAVPIFGFLVSLLMIGEVLTFYSLSRLLGLFWRSHNAEGCIRASGESRQSVVLTAHIDSALEAGITSAKTSRLLLILMILAPALINLATIAHLYGLEKSFVEMVRAPAALFLLACTAIMTRQFLIAEAVPGAADNASGMAALVLAAQSIPPLEHTDLWLVGTGSEEAGLFGIVDFLRRRKLPTDSTWFINLDQLGRGPVSAITTGGMLIPLRAHPWLADQAAKLGAKHRTFRDMSTDACPCMIRGYRTISLMGAMDHWHQNTDTPDEVDPTIATTAAAIAANIAITLDTESQP